MDNDKEELAKLEDDLYRMVEEDNLYWLRNEAKFRAARHATTYKDFREFVQMAHLKPLDKNDSLNFSNQKTIWNPINSKSPYCNNSTASKSDADDCSQYFKAGCIKSADFLKAWRHYKDNKEELFNLLSSMASKGSTLQEIPADILSKIPAILIQRLNINPQDYEICLDILETFAKTPRFKLNKLFFSKAVEKDIGNLFELLETHTNINDRVKLVKPDWF